MTLLVCLLLLAVPGVVWLVRSWYRRWRLERQRQQARLKVVAAQIAGLRAVQRISAIEHQVILHMMSVLTRNPEGWR
jgi:hypothetical protein